MVSAAKLLRPPIRTLGLARCLRDTGPNGDVGRQTHFARSVKLYFKKKNLTVTNYWQLQNMSYTNLVFVPETHSMRPTCMKRRFFLGQKGSRFALARPITAKQWGDPYIAYLPWLMLII